jgi:hypothetical protein
LKQYVLPLLKKPSSSHCEILPMSDQYTFQTHLSVVANKRTTEDVMTPHLVQARKRGIVYCASIIDYVTFASGLELWKVNCTSPESFVGYFQPKNIRACGDYRCTCVEQHLGQTCARPQTRSVEDERRAGRVLSLTPNFCQAGVVAPPDSPNFGNLAITTEF